MSKAVGIRCLLCGSSMRVARTRQIAGDRTLRTRVCSRQECDGCRVTVETATDAGVGPDWRMGAREVEAILAEAGRLLRELADAGSK